MAQKSKYLFIASMDIEAAQELLSAVQKSTQKIPRQSPNSCVRST